MTEEVNFHQKDVPQKDITLEHVKKLITDITPQWENDPNIQSLCYDFRNSNNELDPEIVIKFYVWQKETDIKKIESLGSKFIPESIEGIPTEVEEIGKVENQWDPTGKRGDKAYDPLVGGCQSSNANLHQLFWAPQAGTLGSICFDEKTGAPMALSNWHVWADGGKKGDTIIQPGTPREEDRVKAYFEAAFCGPGSYIIEWEAPSALATALYSAAAASALAAAASDKIDPSRKGQGKTIPNTGELTSKEAIDMKIEYLTQPIPGTPFELKVNWDYTRHTNKKIYTYQEEEYITNEHVLISKHLKTNKEQYLPGEKLELHASLETNVEFDCNDYYYVVAYLVPLTDESRKIPVVLHPTQCYPEVKIPRISHSTPSLEKTCIDFSKEKPGKSYPDRFTHLGAEFNAPSNKNFLIVDIYKHDNKGELALFPSGMFIKIPPSKAVEAHIVTLSSQVNMKAYGMRLGVGQSLSSPQQGVVHKLRIEADRIDQVEFSGGDNEASMLIFCYEPVESSKELGSLVKEVTPIPKKEKSCCFKGTYTLDPKEKPGKWNAFLFVQTVNIVPDGTPAEKAAQIIGGLPVSKNMEDSKNVKNSNIKCGACAVSDYMFEVIPPGSGTLIQPIQKISKQKKCQNCQAALKEDSKFCPICGAKVAY